MELAWRLTFKRVLTVLLLACAAGSHFMMRYHVVIDGGMITKVLQTDMHEVLAFAGLAPGRHLVVARRAARRHPVP